MAGAPRWHLLLLLQADLLPAPTRSQQSILRMLPPGHVPNASLGSGAGK